jgi:hypothetical protein
MSLFSKYINKCALLLLTVIASATLLSSPVFADPTTNAPVVTQDTTNLIPLEITPVCSDASTSTAFWQVNNKNTSDVEIDWTNIDNGQTGSYSAIPGMTQLSTYFDSTDPNNTTSFSSEGNVTQTNATEAPCAPVTPPPATCIDGSVQQNLDITWVSPNQVTVQTVNDQPLCNSVSIDFSSYVMPASYNGQGFYLVYDPTNPANDVPNPTAFPQTIFDNQGATLEAGTDGLTTLTVNLPCACNNTQVDVYYGPEQTTIGPDGNGTANIASQIYPSNGACSTGPTNPGGGSGGGSGTNPVTPPVTPPVTGGKGSGFVETASTTTPIVATTNIAVPATLAYTGESPVKPYAIALSLIGLTGSLVYAVRKDARLKG